MRALIQAVIIQIILLPYVLYRGYQALPPKKIWRIPYLVIFITEWLIFFFGYLFYDKLSDDVMTAINFYGNIWFTAGLYITILLIILELIRLSNWIIPWFPEWVKKHLPQIKLTLFFSALIGSCILLTYGFKKALNPVVTHIHVTLPKGTSTRDSLTIAMMSDLHIGEIIGKKMVKKYVALSNAQHPDMVVLVGDIMHHEPRFAIDAHIEEDLRELEAPLGIYIVYGNHEYRGDRDEKNQWLNTIGGTLLVDSVVMPDSTFYLVGRDDYINKERKPLNEIMTGVDHSKPIIVLDHQPNSFDESMANQVDLGLHGHTHNGQIWPYSALLKLVYDQPYGYYRKGSAQFYVSS
ncbi:metallophosphoesterase, partial [Parabacteroides sp. OttesenSCG-928-G21]|nr:metallophosphoesterase [Parabacteroides sp. OttesenSCG-928-G21]